MNIKKILIPIVLILFITISLSNTFSPVPLNIDFNKMQDEMIQFIKDNPEIIEKQNEKTDFNIYITERISNNTSRDIITVTCPVLLVDFPDNKNTVNKNYFDYLLNDYSQLKSNYPNTRNVTSAKEYYLEESNYTIEIRFDVYNWTILDKNYFYYVDGQYSFGEYPKNTHGMFEDLINNVDSYIDFSEYDMNNDGYIDFVTVIHSGPGQEVTGNENDIWSHKTSFEINTNDGVKTNVYSVQPEYYKEPNDGTIGVFVHEFGHLIFGLVDLYDTDYSSYGIGEFGLMSFGSWGSLDEENDGSQPSPLTQYHKTILEFESYTNIVNETGEEFSLTLKRGEILKIKHPSLFREYLLIQYLKETSYSKSLPGGNEGLIIEHIDENLNSNKSEWYPPLDPMSDGRFLVQIKQKDYLFDLEKKKNKGEPKDRFYNGDTFIYNNSNTNNYNFEWYYWVEDERYVNITDIKYNPINDEYTLYFNGEEPNTIEIKPYKVISFQNKLGENIVLIKTKDNSIPIFESNVITDFPIHFKKENNIYFYNLTDYEMNHLTINGKSLIEYSI